MKLDKLLNKPPLGERDSLAILRHLHNSAGSPVLYVLGLILCTRSNEKLVWFIGGIAMLLFAFLDGIMSRKLTLELIKRHKNSNQRLEPTVKTPVD